MALQPVCYWEDCTAQERYLARNDPEAQEGYTLWRYTADTTRRYHLVVGLRKEGDFISCSIGKAK